MSLSGVPRLKLNQKFYKPDYNPQTRKQYYDDPGAHKRAMDKAFSNGDGVTDLYGSQTYQIAKRG